MDRNDLCPHCGQPTLELDEMSCTVACAQCGAVVNQAGLVNSVGFWNERAEGHYVAEGEGPDQDLGAVSGSTQDKAVAELSRIASAINLPSQLTEEARYLLISEGLSRCTFERRIAADLVAGAILCGVARQHNVPLYASDVAQALSVRPHSFWMVAASVLAILNMNYQDETPDAAVQREQARLEAFLKKGIHDLVPDPATQAIILADAQMIFHWMHVQGLARSIPLRNLGAVVQIAAQGLQVRLRSIEVAAAFRQSEEALLQRSINLRHGLVQVANQLPWMANELNVRNVAQFARSLACSGIVLSSMHQGLSVDPILS